MRACLLAFVHRPRHAEAVHVRFGAHRHGKRNRVDAHAFGVQQACLRDGIAEIGAPVADDHDVTPAVGGEDRTRELHRRREVGVVRIRTALELSELGIGAHADLDLRVPSEADDSGPVGALTLGEDALHGRALLVDGALRARRKVGQDHQGLLGWRGLKLEAGERAGEQQDDQHADAK